MMTQQERELDKAKVACEEIGIDPRIVLAAEEAGREMPVGEVWGQAATRVALEFGVEVGPVVRDALFQVVRWSWHVAHSVGATH